MIRLLPRRWGVPARLGVGAAGLLWLTAVILSAYTYATLAASRAAGDEARARLMAQAVAVRLDRALGYGIPLQQLVGVPALLQQRMAAYPEVDSIAVLDSGGRDLWRSMQRNTVETLPLGLGLLSPPAVSVDQSLVVQGVPVGVVRLVVRSPGLIAFMRSVAAPLTLGCLLFAGLAWLAAVLAQAAGRDSRDRAVRHAARDIFGARYDRLTLVLQRRAFDLRPQQMARAARSVHEMLVRARRQIGSLRQTEPSPSRRDWLDKLIADAEGNGRFSADLQVRRVVASDAQCAWLALMAGTGGSATLACASMHALPGWAQPWVSHAPWLVGLWVLALAAGALASVGVRRSASPAIVAALTALVLLALGGFVSWALQGSVVALLAAILAGAAMGLALTACEGVQRAMRVRQDLLPIGRRPWWPLAAWCLGVLCFGPAAVGLLRATAQVDVAAAVFVPVLLALAMVWRWNVARSPWRSRLRPAVAEGAQAGRGGLWAVGVGAAAAALPACAAAFPELGAARATWAVGAALLAGGCLALGLLQNDGGSVRPVRAAALAGALLLAVTVGVGLVGDGRALHAPLSTTSAGWNFLHAWLVPLLQAVAAGALGYALSAPLRRVRLGRLGEVRGGAGTRFWWRAAAGAALVALAFAGRPWAVEALASSAQAQDVPVIAVPRTAPTVPGEGRRGA